MKKLKEYVESAEGMRQMMADINAILDDFDFGAVYTTMEALSWEWGVPNGMVDEYRAKGKLVSDREYSGFELYRPDYDDVVKKGRNFLFEEVSKACERDDYEFNCSTGGFEVEVEVLDDETRKRAFGDDAPDDFEHSVEIRFRFVVESNMPKSW